MTRVQDLLGRAEMGVTVAALVLLKKSHLLLMVLGDRVGHAGQLGNGLVAEK